MHPQDCRFERQMQYGSIGWSVGATLGYQAAVASQRRVMALTGDGAFQMTAQQLSTMLRYKLKPVIFLFNNDGHYNVINDWNYTGLVDVFNKNGKSPCLARQVKTAGELQAAITDAKAFDGLCFIEVFIDKDDCKQSLLKWGSYVGTANGDPPLSFQQPRMQETGSASEQARATGSKYDISRCCEWTQISQLSISCHNHHHDELAPPPGLTATGPDPGD